MKFRAGAAVAIAAAIALGVAACAPISTMKHYDPSDGVSANVGQVKVLNALIITTSGSNGNLLFSGYNNSDELVQLTVQYTVGGVKQSKTATLLPDSTSNFGYTKKTEFILPGIDTRAGSLLPIYFQYGTETGQQVDVPVLDGSLPQYAGLVPTSTPTPTTTAKPVLPPPVPAAPTPTATTN